MACVGVNGESNLVFPLYELPFTGGFPDRFGSIPDALQDGEIGKLQPIVPGRGLIYDRKGRILADNVPAYRLEVVPEQAGDLKWTLAELNKLVGISPEEMQAFEANRKAIRSFRPVVLKLRLSEEERAVRDSQPGSTTTVERSPNTSSSTSMKPNRSPWLTLRA